MENEKTTTLVLPVADFYETLIYISLAAGYLEELSAKEGEELSNYIEEEREWMASVAEFLLTACKSMRSIWRK